MKPLYIVAVNLPAPTADLAHFPPSLHLICATREPVPSEITYPPGKREFSDRRSPASYTSPTSSSRMFADGTPRELFRFFVRSARLPGKRARKHLRSQTESNKSIYVRARGKNRVYVSLSLPPLRLIKNIVYREE